MPDKYRILVVNPRTSFTKIAVFDNYELVFLNKVNHSQEELNQFDSIMNQHEYRKNIVLKEIQDADIDPATLSFVVGRGGLIKPVKSGVYEINETMVRDLQNSPVGVDSVNLGGLIADDIAQSLNIKAYICDPVVVDELEDIARITGHPDFEKKSVFHALNQKAMAKRYAKSMNKAYEDINLIVAHMGIGISIGAHKKGKVIDGNQVFDGDGPFSAKRTGTLPVGDLVRMCYSGKYTLEEMLKQITGKGGMMAYFGTDNMKVIEEKALNGDRQTKLIYDAMAYQVAKYIGMMAPVLHCDIDGIILTGGIAHSSYFTNLIIERISKLAPVHVYPGGDEMEALAFNVLSALNGEIPIQTYK